MNLKYQLFIDEWDGKQHKPHPYCKYDSLEEAIKAWKYLAHHNSSLGAKFSIREAAPEGV